MLILIFSYKLRSYKQSMILIKVNIEQNEGGWLQQGVVKGVNIKGDVFCQIRNCRQIISFISNAIK